MSIYACELSPAWLKYTAKKVVILWGGEDLLSFAVENLLNSSSEIQITRISKQSSIQFLISEVERTCPDIVIISQQDNASKNYEIPLLFTHSQKALKIITINHQNNIIEIFNKQQIAINTGADLISIVEGCPNLSGG